MNKQLSFCLNSNPIQKQCGGSLATGKRKELRTLDRGAPLHLVLKANTEINLFEHCLWIEDLIYKYARRFGVLIYAESVQVDHIHLCIRIHDRAAYNNFVRTLTGQLAKRFGKGLWKVRPYTRVASWGKEFQAIKAYLRKNDLEVHGLVAYRR